MLPFIYISKAALQICQVINCTLQNYSNSLPVGKGRLKERCGLETSTNFFPFKKVAKTRCGLDSGAD
jgi:hypothetical protein